MITRILVDRVTCCVGGVENATLLTIPAANPLSSLTANQPQAATNFPVRAD